jgi:signal transduction histidine kinase
MRLATQIFLGFLIAISIDLLDSFVNYTLTLKVRTNSDFLGRSEAVIRHSADLSKEMVEMQSAYRGFLLTGDQQFLEPYYDGLKTVPVLAAEERSLVLQKKQQTVFDSILLLHDRWIQYADDLINAKKKAAAGRSDSNRYYLHLLDTQFSRGVGKAYNDRIAVLFQLFDDAEYHQRNERRAMLSASIDRTDWYSLLFSIFLVIVGLGIAVYLVRRISARIRTLVGLAERISRGDFGVLVDDRNDELSSLSISLNTMSARLSSNIGELEKKNKELNAFAYVVSHDLKAPVRGIANVVKWIEEDLENEISAAMRRYLDFIVERIGRMEGLIDGMLEYARAGRMAVVNEQVDVERLVKEVVETIVPKEYSLQIGALPVLYTQKLPLQQVFANLIGNAVKYTPPDGAEISVTCVEEASYYRFSVKDNGPGIDPEYHEKIFGLFQTLREKNDKESTGIGLAIVRKIVEERGGTVMLESRVGEGAAFIFTWPKISG